MRALSLNAVALAALLALAACGGSSRGFAPTASMPMQRVAFSIRIPQPTGKTPQYVSPSTKSAAIAVTGASATTTTTINCTSTACSGDVPAPVGSDTFVVKLYDQANAAGNVLSQGSLTQTIVADQKNTVTVTFGGVVASIVLSLGQRSFVGSSSGTTTLTVTAKDAGGNTIIGPGGYENPVTISTSGDRANQVTFTPSTLDGPPSSPISVSYNGGGTAESVIFAATASGVSAANAPPAVLSLVAVSTESVTMFHTTDTSDGTGNLLAIAPGANDTLWVGTATDHIWAFTTAGTQVEDIDTSNVTNQAVDTLVTGPDGNLWFTGEVSPAPAPPFAIGKVSETISGTAPTPVAYPFTPLFCSPYGTHSSPNPCPNPQPVYPTYPYDPPQMIVGPDKNLWFTYDGGIGKATTAGVVTTYALPEPFGQNSLADGSDGNVWYSTDPRFSAIGAVTTGGVLAFDQSGVVATTGNGWGTQGQALVARADGDLWAADASGNGPNDCIARFSPAHAGGTIALTEYGCGAFPPPAGNTHTVTSATLAPNGDMYVSAGGNWVGTPPEIAQVGPNGEITLFTSGFTSDCTPGPITAGPDGNVWFACQLMTVSHSDHEIGMLKTP